MVLHLNSHKSFNENEEQTKAKARGVLIEREKIGAIFSPLIDSIAINISTIHAYLKIKYPVIKKFYNFLECTISFAISILYFSTLFEDCYYLSTYIYSFVSYAPFC